MLRLTDQQRELLRNWRRKVINAGHILPTPEILQIEEEIKQWDSVRSLDPESKYFEAFNLCNEEGQSTGVTAWRGLCHWLWLRHGCVHGMLFTPTKLAIFQRRSDSVEDSPGFLDMTFAGHIGTDDLDTAMQSEALGEVGLKLSPNEDHIANPEDLVPIYTYHYIEPPRIDEEFYNIEVRHVYAVRISSYAADMVRPLDGETSSFQFASLKESWGLLRANDVASALQVSGPLALYHAMRKWEWNI